jgi:N-sulfoglucosamine sulfohydrolase
MMIKKLNLSLFALVILSGALCSAAQPNILFIVSEDNGPELGCYGDTNASNNNMTPTLDQMARDGVLFYNAFVPFSVCSPSRACFYTGTHIAQNGHEGLATHKFAMYEEYPTFYKLLQEVGYRTGLIGKLHINPENAVSNYIDYRAITGANFNQSGRNMTNYANKANDFIAGNYTEADTSKPFVLTINYPDAHLPLHNLAPTSDPNDADTLPKNPIGWEDVQTFPWLGATSQKLRTDTAAYYNCLRRLDDGIAMVLQHLDDAGYTNDTLIIYMGDHGAQFSRGKTSVYEAGLRVPLIVKWPGNTVDRPGSDLAGEFNHDTQLVSTTDIMPTMLQAAGVDIPSHCTGYALQPLLKNETAPWRKYIFGHGTGSFPGGHYTQLSVRGERYKLIYNPFKEASMPTSLQNLYNRSADRYLRNTSGWLGPLQSELDDASTPQNVRDAYARYLNPSLYELYDLQADPYEWDNLADDPAHVAKKQELIEALDAWQSDPIIADPWRDLTNVENFGLMMEDAIGTNYKSNGLPWDYLDPNVSWNYPDWRETNFPTSIYVAPQPNPATLYGTNFEQSEGFTFPATGAFALFPAGTTTDSNGGVWVGDGGNSGVWNRSDIPPEGVQALRIGVDGGGTSSATVTLPVSVTEIGYLRFSYANYSQSTSCTATVKIREQQGTTPWTDIWQKSFTGLQVDWHNKPWPFAEITLNQDYPNGIEIQFHCTGDRGMKVDQLSVTEKFTPLPDPTQTYEQWRAVVFSPADAADDNVSGKYADPDGDGTENCLEYLLKTSPLQADSWLAQPTNISNGYANFTISGYAHATDLWSMEYSTNMTDWYPWTKRRLILEDQNGLQQWQVTVPPVSDGNLFLRVTGE